MNEKREIKDNIGQGLSNSPKRRRTEKPRFRNTSNMEGNNVNLSNSAKYNKSKKRR